MKPTQPPLTVREVIALTTKHLADRGMAATARLDAELLIGEAVGLDRLGIYLNLDRPLDSGERERARGLLRRRAAYEPIAYILGRREFYSREFQVDKRVLIPRPETELLVEHALGELRRKFGGRKPLGEADCIPIVAEGSAFPSVSVSPEKEGEGLRVLELGAGSGAIAVTLAAELPGATVVATEASAEAAEVAEANARRHGVAGRVRILVQDDFRGIGGNGEAGQFHAIISNPPYIDPAARSSLPPDVREHEPAQALFAEDEGYAVYKWLAREAPLLLVDGGFMAVEVGAGQAAEVERLGREAGLAPMARLKDYAGIERIVAFEKARAA